MKKIFGLIILATALVCLLTACDLSMTPGMQPKEDVITIVDGYLVVNGVKTEHKIHSEPVISVIDGYVAVNGVKTEYKVDKADEITVVDGYLVVNGVKTEYVVSEHIWTTVTTKPTCTMGGYDTMTCKLCDKSVILNETAPLRHQYETAYTTDENYHWHKCASCDATTEKQEHEVNADGACDVCGIAISATAGVIYDVSEDKTYAEVVGYEGTARNVKIADEYNGLPVKNIYNNAFYQNETITSVVIPDSVTTIGDSAFFYCYSLSSVVIGDSVTTIGDSAFAYCDSLSSVVIPDSVTTVGDSAFYECSSLSSVVIPDSVTTIGSDAFFYCYSLSSVVIPDSVTTIGDYAFAYCFSLSSVVIGDSVTTIGRYAFYVCSSLSSVVIPDSVTTIGEYAFDYCSSLTTVYYTGSEEEWKAIAIIGSFNSYLTDASIYYNYVKN